MKEFQQYREDTDKRFEAITKELQQYREDTNRRFEAFMKEFQQYREDTDKRFEAITKELQQCREATNRRFEESDRRFEVFMKEFQQYREDTDKRFEAIEKRLEEQGEIIKEHSRCIIELQKAVMELQRAVSGLQYAVGELQQTTSELKRSYKGLERAVSAIGRRWGVMAEDAFRRTFIEIVEKKLDIKEIRKWRVYDEEGIVYGKPCWVDADIAIKNRKHILIEIKSSPSQGDISAFYRVGSLYEKKEGVKPHLSMLAVFIEKKDKRFARKLGIEIFSSEEKPKGKGKKV
jgi:hypothetical protein